MEVITRRIKDRFDCDDALHISIEGYESLFVISDSSRKEPGTSTVLSLRPVNPWSRMGGDKFIQCIKTIVPNPAVQIEIETNEGSETYTDECFNDLDLKLDDPLSDYSWSNLKNIRQIDINLACSELGFKGKGCVGILIKNNTPTDIIKVISKDIEIEGEIYTLSSDIKYGINCISENSTTITAGANGDIEVDTSPSQRCRSKSFLSIRGIEVPCTLFGEYFNNSKTVLNIPFPIIFRLDVGKSSDLNLNSARNQIIFDDKWLKFEENIYSVICKQLKSKLDNKDWEKLKDSFHRNNTSTFISVAENIDT
jgi:hypothetical protein